MVLGSVRLHGWVAASPARAIRVETSLGGVVAVLVGYRSPATPLSFGAISGLLPCPLVYAMLVLAARTGDVRQGMFMLLAFGLGTTPTILLSGLFGDRYGTALARLGAHPAAAYLMALGLLTSGSGLLPILGRGPFGG
jgi:hypothetical protein